MLAVALRHIQTLPTPATQARQGIEGVLTFAAESQNRPCRESQCSWPYCTITQCWYSQVTAGRSKTEIMAPVSGWFTSTTLSRLELVPRRSGTNQTLFFFHTLASIFGRQLLSFKSSSLTSEVFSVWLMFRQRTRSSNACLYRHKRLVSEH
jgi:hypothetical protein